MVRQHHLIRGAVALAAALTIAPVAWADPAPLAKAEAIIAANRQTSPAVRANPDQQTGTRATTDPGPCSEVCSGGAASYGSPSHRPLTPDESGATLPHSGRPGPSARSEARTLSLAEIQSGAIQAGLQRLSSTASTRPTAVRLVNHDGGFQWGDAGIGAGGMLALTLIGFGGSLVATHRRNHRIDTPHASQQPSPVR